ncbi:hypothetical protein FSP39_004931 [Pinctada imbricata]|uniref:Uncharacterized protein n=1 Tax=Pinctada imbricata TaxID=66713 RepID=A0AA88YH60_PINIB|nr:hypothetical protein FSP39_004931 [Pinctada imbricata]
MMYEYFCICFSHLPQKDGLRDGVYAANCENCGHFFKFRAKTGLASSITLSVNGQKYTEDHFGAISAAGAVKVTYTDQQPPILTLEEGIKQKSFFPGVGEEITVGDAEAYYCPNWHVIPHAVKTNTPLNTACRAPACGEPPLCMSCSALFAVKHAIEAVRKDLKQDTFFALNAPATVEKVQQLCMVDPSQFVI